MNAAVPAAEPLPVPEVIERPLTDAEFFDYLEAQRQRRLAAERRLGTDHLTRGDASRSCILEDGAMTDVRYVIDSYNSPVATAWKMDGIFVSIALLSPETIKGLESDIAQQLREEDEQ